MSDNDKRLDEAARLAEAQNKAAIARLDEFINATSGLGTLADDRSLTTFMLAKGFLPQQTLEELYKSNPIAKRIVNRPAEDATRVPFIIENVDTDIDVKQVESELETLDVMSWLQLGLRWSRLYGGALGFIATNDKCPLHEPLKINRVTKIRGLHVLDRHHAIPRGTRFSLQKSGFMVPEQYELIMPNGKRKIVHKSRTVRFEGVPLPIDLLSQNEYWGLSELEAPWEDLRRLYVTRQYLENFVHETSIAVMKIEGLRKMLASKAPDGTDPKEKVAEALQNLRRQATNFHWLGIDANDDYSLQTKPMAGLDSIEDSFVAATVMSSDMPRSILLGETPGGLNSGENAGEVRSYYDWISAQQESKLTPVVTRLMDVVFSSMHNRSVAAAEDTGDKSLIWPQPQEYTIEWPALWQQSEEGSSQQAKLDAETDKILIDMGAVTAAEVRQARVVEGLTGPLRLRPKTDEVTGKEEEQRTGVTVGALGILAELVQQVMAGLVPKGSAIALARIAVPDMSVEAAEELFAEAGNFGAVAAETAGMLEGEADFEPEGATELPSVEPPPKDLMKAKDIAVQLGISPATIKTLARKGEIQFWKFGSQYRYSLAEVIGSNRGSTAQVVAATDEDTHTHMVDDKPTSPPVEQPDGTHAHTIEFNGQTFTSGPPLEGDGGHLHTFDIDGAIVKTSSDPEIGAQSEPLIVPEGSPGESLPPATDT